MGEIVRLFFFFCYIAIQFPFNFSLQEVATDKTLMVEVYRLSTYPFSSSSKFSSCYYSQKCLVLLCLICCARPEPMRGAICMTVLILCNSDAGCNNY